MIYYIDWNKTIKPEKLQLETKDDNGDMVLFK